MDNYSFDKIETEQPSVESYRILKDNVSTYVVHKIYTCDCKGFIYSGNCKHIAMIKSIDVSRETK